MTFKKSLLTQLVCLSCAMVLVGCDGDDDDGGGGGGGGTGNGPIAPTSPDDIEVFVMQNGAANAGQIAVLEGDLSSLGSFQIDANEGIVFDSQGNLYAMKDDQAPLNMVQVINNAVRRVRSGNTNDIPNIRTDRMFTVNNANLFKGVELSERDGLMFIANHQGNTVDVYSTAAGSGAIPVSRVATPASCWDLEYDNETDRAFLALTDGTIMVIDNFVSQNYSTENARLINPNPQDDPSNMHGIAYHSETDQLVVTDVGSAQDPNDGKLFVVANASTASGDVIPVRSIAGPASMLGNPVDLQLVGSTAYIAEKSNDKVLMYSNVLEGDNGDIPADLAVDIIKPESLDLVPKQLPSPVDNSDIETSNTVARVAVTLNPAEPVGNPDLIQLDTGLSSVTTEFTTNITVESVKYNSLGDAFITYDSEGVGGIYVIGRAATQRNLGRFTERLDRRIQGPNTGLVSPKGLDFAEQLGWIIVTENNPDDMSVKVFGANADGNAIPLFSTGLPARPLDADYEPNSDQLFVALVDGTIAVFDNFSQTRGAGGLSRRINPSINGVTIASQNPSNMHGIVYVASEDVLLVSDVGDGGNPTDGKLYGFENASTANGPTDVMFSIDDNNNDAAGNTLLGNPVDIAFDGQNLYVAEKSQDRVLRFDDILNTNGGDVTPDQVIPQIKPESVALLPSVLIDRN